MIINNSFLLGIISSTFFLGILLFIEFITRKSKLNKEYTRRLAHVLSGIFAAIMGMILDPTVFIFFSITFLIIISISFGAKFFSSIHNVKRKTYGEIFLPLGILIAYILSGGPNIYYLAGVLILAISDPVAGFIGDFSSKKQSLGSIGFFISSLLILVFVFDFRNIILLIFISLILTFVERESNYGVDNLTVPLASSLMFKLFF